MPFTLVSHAHCPYVQRIVIALAERGVDFERLTVDLFRKPDWLLAISPLGRTPVLNVGDDVLFESVAILEYLEETLPIPLHPMDSVERARDRDWIGFGSECLNNIAGFFSARDAQKLDAGAASLHARFRVMESHLGDGPWFGGNRFGLVDAVIAPAFRYFDTFDAIDDVGVFKGLAKIPEWRREFSNRTSVLEAVGADYGDRLERFIERKGSALVGGLSVRVSLSTPSDVAGTT